MTQIHVDPEQLRELAAQMAALSDELETLRAQIGESVSDAPDYEGQFGPLVEALASEADSQIRAQRPKLSDSADDLTAIASGFEAADEQSIHELNLLARSSEEWRNRASISLAQLFGKESFLWQVLGKSRGGPSTLYPGPGGGKSDEDAPPWWAPAFISAAEALGSYNRGFGLFVRDLIGIGWPSSWAMREASQFPTDVPMPSELPHLNDATREDLLYWSEQFGFGTQHRPTIDEFFDPYSWEDPTLEDTTFRRTQPLKNASEQLYAELGGVELATWENVNNPLNFRDEDPISMLEGEERLHMGLVLPSNYSKYWFGDFLRRVGAEETLYWNYEPSWLAAKMEWHPNQLTEAQFKVLQEYSQDPEAFAGLALLDAGGATE